MRISWREVLGLLAGLAMCFVVVAAYALTGAPQYRETAFPEQPQTTSAQQTQEASNEKKSMLSVRVTGSVGEQFSGQFSTLESTRPVVGVTPTDYQLETHDDPSAADFVFVTVAKTSDNDHELKVQILDEGKAVKEGSSTKPYGVVSLTWSPDEQKPSG